MQGVGMFLKGWKRSSLSLPRLWLHEMRSSSMPSRPLLLAASRAHKLKQFVTCTEKGSAIWSELSMEEQQLLKDKSTLVTSILGDGMPCPSISANLLSFHLSRRVWKLPMQLRSKQPPGRDTSFEDPRSTDVAVQDHSIRRSAGCWIKKHSPPPDTAELEISVQVAGRQQPGALASNTTAFLVPIPQGVLSTVPDRMPPPPGVVGRKRPVTACTECRRRKQKVPHSATGWLRHALAC